MGCQFAKWRMVVNIGDDIPSLAAIEEGARGLAMYAGICQRNGYRPDIDILKKKLECNSMIAVLFPSLSLTLVVLELMT